MTNTPEPPGYDEVRRKLLERGYLQDPIERFVLEDLLAPGRGLLRLVRADFKASLIGGPVLGALLAGAAAAANRPLVGVRDFAVIWLYFALLSAAALFVLDLVAATIVGAMARRRGARPSDALRAALIVGVPTLVYIVALWWRRNESAGTAADFMFLAAAVAATVVIARLGALVSLAGIVGRTGDLPRRGRRPAAALAALFAVGAALYTLVPRTDHDERRQEPSPFEEAGAADPLVVLAIDGLDGDLIEGMAGRGAVDAILALMSRGAVFPIARGRPVEPPEIWTTIATGMDADTHGVRAAGAERLPGIAAPLHAEAGPLPLAAALRFLLPVTTVPTTSEVRRVRTLWEVVALKRPSAVVGWWSTWPARQNSVNGARSYVVSDRVLVKLLAGAPADRDTWPESLYQRLQSGFAARRQAWRAEFERAFPQADRSQTAWESFLIDAFALATAEDLLGDTEIRAAFVYLPGLDILRYRLDDELRAGALTRTLRAQESIETYVRWLDGRIRAQADTGPGRLMLVADPGRRGRRGAEGFVAIAGPPAIAGCVGPVIDPMDVAPLVLDLCGFPASAEMHGKAPAVCLEPHAARPRVATFGRRPTGAPSPPSAFDAEMIERLRSLGYVR